MKNLALLLIAILVGAVASEAAVRLAGFRPRTVEVNRFFVPGETSWSMPDPELGWINKPGVSRAIGDDVRMTFWDHGRRATRDDPAPPAGIPIMIIGGSNAQSYGVADRDTFAYRLGQRDPRLSIENFGNGGYGTVQALMLAERALKDFYKDTKPKVIVLAFDDAHILRNVSDQSWVFTISDFAGRYAAPPHYRLENGALTFHPYRSIGFWPLETHSAALTLLHNVWLQSLAYNTKDQALAVTREVIARLAALAKANGAVFGVAVLEDRGGVTPALFRDAPFPHVDCSGPGRADPKGTYMAANGHPNPALHAYFTQCIGEWLDKDVLPKLDPAP
ncbi:MAG: hypothetical protein K1X51_09460 [Rhodospirillaceae bacterium]|nr:hypothetical protein [Rhodospirillaceae bacterium]